MMINTTRGVVFDPTAYPGRLLITLETEGRMGCGVFSGRHAGFEGEAEMQQKMPTVQIENWSDGGVEVFEIVRLPRAPKNQLRKYPYVVTSWQNLVYTEFAKSKELILTEHSQESAPPLWEVAFAKVRVILPSYGS